MPSIVFVAPLKFSPDGHTVVRYRASAEPVEVSEECARIAIGAGFAHAAEEPTHAPHTKPRTRAKGKG